MDLPADARLYLHPVQFVDTPVGRDGEVARLAGGMNWFAAYRAIWRRGGARIATHTVPVAAFDAWRDTLPAAQAERAAVLAQALSAARAPLVMGARVLRLDQPLVMGILNMTPDSFSDGGAHLDDPAAAAAAGVDMAGAGAALIDVGGESTRPGAQSVWEVDEIGRVVPVIERLAAAGCAVSIDTRKAGVMQAALAAGAGMVNDVAALLFDDRAPAVVAQSGAPVVLMHSPDPDRGGHGAGGYRDVLLDVFDWLDARVAAVVAAGVRRDRIVIDPGIGFGKSLADNCALLNGLALLHGIGCPLLLGASRKRLVGALSDEAPADKRLGGSLALALHGASLGVQLLRVHDVAETVQGVRVWRGLRDAALVGR